MKVQLSIFLFTLILILGCTKDTLVNSYMDLGKDGWAYDEILTDSFEINHPDHYHQLLTNLKINTDYSFANIQLKITLLKPDSTSQVFPISIPLAEKSGKWLGSGLGSTITFQEPILHRKLFDLSGKYYITLEQNMRLENLSNIISAGIRINKQEEIF
ncbi:MAG: gliding motility lipoprotein GldH [Bacteroidia bacterium]|nr:gliding motility lipoprotein GldH [Bacteroidia bacterium]